MSDIVGLDAPSLCAAAGVTYRQLDSWTRLGLVPSQRRHAGSGYPRTYPPEAVRVAIIMAALVRAGFTVAAAHRIATARPESTEGDDE